jgi:RNA polymerase sigma-70 factor (ECF subfamily)
VETTIPLTGSSTRARDHGSFSKLYGQYARMVHGILLGRVPRSEVEDLAQEVFLNAWRMQSSLRDHEAAGGWLARIARNQAIDYHRRTPPTTELDPESLRQNPVPPEAMEVLETIKTLPDAYRETLILRLVEGMTGPEIAAQTGLTADSVRVNLHRGMKLLRDKLEGKAP